MPGSYRRRRPGWAFFVGGSAVLAWATCVINRTAGAVAFACATMAACMLCYPVPAAAQHGSRSLPLIGWLRIAVPEQEAGKPLRQALAAHGLVSGEKIRFEIRSAEGQIERFPALAEALVRDGAKIIVSFGPDATRAAMAATKTIPIVAVSAFVEEGLVSQLSRPAGNLTGVSILVNELDPKKLEVLKELLPETSHVAVLNDAATRIPERPAAMAAAADQLRLKLTTQSVTAPAEFEAAFQSFRAAAATALAINSSTLFATMRSQLGALSSKYRLPAICQWREMVESGCLASYGPTQKEMFELVADYVARVLAGARPESLPIVQPRRFELVINQKVAREMGLTIPQRMLDRADEVIE